MKQTILSLFLFFSILLAAHAQRHVDISATKIYTPNADIKMTPGQKVYLQFSVTNYGPDSFKVTDSIILYAASRTGFYFVPADSNRITALTYPRAVHYGETVGFADSLFTTWSGYPSDTAGYLCILAMPKGMAGDSLVDPIPLNNSLCQSEILTDVPAISNILSKYSVYPNPACNYVNFDMTLLQSAAVNISVYDITGRELLVRSEVHTDAGRHQFTLSTSGLTEGLYFYKMVINGQTVSGKLLVSR